MTTSNAPAVEVLASPRRSSFLRSRLARPRKWFAALGLGLPVLLFAYVLIGPSPAVEVIAKGRVYKSGTLPHERLIDEVQNRGIRTVVDLRETEADARAEGEALAAVGVEHVSIPSSQVPSAEAVAAFLELLEDDDSYPILIHCRHGYGRAQVFSAIYRMEYEGWDNERARRATRSALRLPFSSFKEGEPKAEFLLSYAPRRGASAHQVGSSSSR